jgi:putative ABC transport system ATP-binding protein
LKLGQATPILGSLLLNIENLRKSYGTPDGSVQAVVDVPVFSLDTAQQMALCGTSGSGKTTFLNLIAGILQPDEGRIELDTFQQTSWPKWVRRSFLFSVKL